MSYWQTKNAGVIRDGSADTQKFTRDEQVKGLTLGSGFGAREGDMHQLETPFCFNSEIVRPYQIGYFADSSPRRKQQRQRQGFPRSCPGVYVDGG